jgi:hypothetical protein
VLLQRGVSVGLVLKDASQLGIAAPVESPPTTGELEGDPGALLEGMKRRWSSLFDISESGSGVNMVSKGVSRCTDAMEIRLKADSFRGTPVEILFQLASRLDPSLKGLPPPGFASVGPPGTEDLIWKSVLMQPVAVDTREGPLLEVLFQVTKAVPAVGWIAAERKTDEGSSLCELGLFTPTLVLGPTYDVSVGLPTQPPTPSH